MEDLSIDFVCIPSDHHYLTQDSLDTYSRHFSIHCAMSVNAGNVLQGWTPDDESVYPSDVLVPHHVWSPSP